MKAPDDDVDATRAYKDVIGELDAAAQALRERDSREVRTVQRQLAEIATEAERAERRAALARLTVELDWDEVVDLLWHEQWMTLRPHPEPDRSAEPGDLDALVAAASRAAEAVREAVRRRSLFGL